MVVTLEAWLQSLKALLPPGRAFTREPGSVLEKLLAGVAAQLLAGQLKVEGLIGEADPRQATTMLADWEQLLDLPDDCAAMQTQQLAPGKYDYQLEDLVTFSRASTATYVSGGLRLTAAANVPRYEDGQLLIEAEGQNQTSRSDEIDSVLWVPSRLQPVMVNAAAGADGAMTLDKMIEDATNGTHRITRTYVVNVSTTYTVSFDVKPAERTLLRFQFINVASLVASNSILIDLATGIFTATDTSRTTVKALSNGVLRISNTVTTTAVGTSLQPELTLRDATGAVTYLGDGVSGIFVGAAQVEVGAASSYIPTTAAAVSRSADVATVRLPQSTFDRQLGAFQRLIEQGGQSIPYFIGIANALGEVGVTITELRGMNCNDDCNAALNTAADNYTWQVNIPRAAANARLANCSDSNCNSSLEDFTPSLIECAFNERKPAHTTVLFVYAS